MWKTLRRAGEQVSRCRVQRLMRSADIQGAKRRGKPWRTTRPDPQAGRRPDLVQRDFTASRPNELWVADLSYLRCWQGLVFFAFVIDAFSRKIVGWQLATHMRTDLVLDALKMALAQRGGGADVELIHHSDRGSQYTSIDYGQTLDDHGVLASVGSVGDAYDNALAESFVDSFKTELIADRVWCSRAQLELATVEWVGWFNHDRLHESLGDVPPVEFEQLHTARGPISGNGSVAGSSPRAANGLTRPRILLGDPVEAQNGADPALSRSTLAAAVAPSETPGPPIDERAAGGSLRSRYALAALTAGAQPTTIR